MSQPLKLIKAAILLAACVMSVSANADPFAVSVVTNPPAGGTITGAGTYSNLTSVPLQIRANHDWYIKDITFDGSPYPNIGGQIQLTPEQSFDKMLLLMSLPNPDFDRTTVTNFDFAITAIGDSTTTAWLALLSPTITQEPTSQVAIAGTTVAFASGASGRKTIAYQWQRDGEDLAGKTSSSLILTNVQAAQSGTYTLVASNAFGLTNSLPANLFIRDVLIFANGQPISTPTMDVDGGTAISFQSSYPSAHIFYTLDGTEPDFEDNQYTGPFFISSSSVLRAIAYKSDFSQSAISDTASIVVHPVFYLDPSSPRGSLILDPPSGPYRSNTLVTITAVPDDGWTFMEWGGALSGSNPTNAILMNADKEVTAMFGTTLETGAIGGTVSVYPAFPLYPYGSTVRLAGIPNPGKFLSQWFFNAQTSQGNPFYVTIGAANPTVSALFGSLPTNHVSLTVLIEGGGFVDEIGTAYEIGNTAVLFASPNPGQQFLGWSGDATGTANSLPLVMDSSKIVTARFTDNPALGISIASESVRLSVSGVQGDVYQIETSTNLSTWTPLITVTNFFDTVTFSDPSTDSPMRMYRTVRP